MVRRGFRSPVLAVIFALAATSAMIAQTGTGLITGRVTDVQGAAIVGARVVATNVATQVKTVGISNQSGIYEIMGLLPGEYSVDASASNFKKALRPNVTVQVEDKIGLNFSLQVGTINETMTITADISPLRTEDAQTGEVITGKMIMTLPQVGDNNQRRDPFGLMTLSGEVQGDGGRVGYSQQNNNYDDTTINGGRTTGIDYFVDGVSVTQGRAHNVSEATPGVEDVAEFKVITNGISAEYGRISGGGVALITKSGSNQFHGQLFEYMYNDMFNANTWDNDAFKASDPTHQLGKKPHFRQNDFGFAIGGPVILPHLYNGKGKTFFFVNWEDVHFREAGQLNTASFPADGSQPGTTNERAGDLTDIGIAAGDPNNPYPMMYDPYGAVSPTPVLAPDGTMQYEHLDLLGGDGRHIPTSAINPVSAAILALTPKPNHAPAAGSSIKNDYVAPANVSSVSPDWSLRIDHNFSDKDKVFGRFTHYSKDYETARWAGPLSTSNSARTNGAFGATLSYDHTFSPTLLMNVTVGGNFTPFLGGSLLPPGFTNTGLGLDPVTLSILGNQNIPNLSVEEQLGQSVNLLNAAGSASRNSTNAVLTAAITKILNRHNLKFGFEGRRYYDSFNTAGGGQSFTDSNGVGQFENIDQTWTPQGDANAFGSFLLGLTDMYQTNGYVNYQLAQNYYAAYAQDDFKVTPKLTLNLGLRWDMETPTTERNNKLYFWDPNAPAPFTPDAGFNFANALTAAGLNPSQVQTPDWVTNGFPKGAVRIAATPEHPSRYGQSYHPFQFSPRLGVAYQVNRDTVVRASFGVMYLPTTGWASAFAGSTGDTLTNSAGGSWNIWHLNQFGFNTGIGTFQNPYTQASIVDYVRSNAIANLQSTGGVGAGGLSATSHMPHEYDWSLGVQRQLPWKLVVEADYSGNASNTLLAKNIVSRFPKSLYVPSNANLYYTQVASPTASSTNTGQTLPLAELEFPYPYFNTVYEIGDNIGSANYESGNLRVQRRFANGLQFLFNYTYSKLLDNVGGPESNNGGSNSGFGEGGKVPQAVDPVTATYGLSPLDQTHRISAFFNYQLPFGRGRTFMNHPSNVGQDLLDGIIGGWELAGESTWHSGNPIIIQITNGQPDVSVRVDSVYGSYAPGATYKDLKGQNFKGPSSVRITPLQSAVPAGVALPINLNALAFPTNGYGNSFTYGTLPSIYAGVRNPGLVGADLSLMKNFPIFSADGSRYLQFRMEAKNVANHPGLGHYNTTAGSVNFGSITTTGQGERHIQMSLRFVF